MTKNAAAEQLAQERDAAFAQLAPIRTVEGTLAELLPSLAQLKALGQLGRAKQRKHKALIICLWLSTVGAAIVGIITAANGPVAFAYTFWVIAGFAVALQLAMSAIAMLRARPGAGGVVLLILALAGFGIWHEVFFLDPIRGLMRFFTPAGAAFGLAFGLSLRAAIVFRSYHDPNVRAYKPFAWSHDFLSTLAETLAPETRLKLFGYEMADDPYEYGWTATNAPPIRQRAADLTIAFDGATAFKVVADVEIQHRVKQNPRGKYKYKGAITRVELTISYAAPSITAQRGAAAAQWVAKQTGSWKQLWEKQQSAAVVKLGCKAKPGLVTTSLAAKYKGVSRASVMVDPPDPAKVSRFALALGKMLA